MSSNYNFRLPVELVETILLLVWFSPLTREHRVIFMTSSLLVDKTWMSLFLRMSFKHVHIPKSSYLDTYLATLGGVSPLLDKETKSSPGLLCQSMNVVIDYTPTGYCREPTPVMEKVLSNLLYFLRLLDTTPQLRTLSIDYVHASFDDVFDFLSYNPLPATLNHLKLRYTSRECDHSETGIALRNFRLSAHIAFTLPRIRHLTIFGGTEAFIASLVSMCPALQTLQLQLTQSNEELPRTREDIVWKCDGACLSIVSHRGCGPNEWKGVLTAVNDNIHTFCRVE